MRSSMRIVFGTAKVLVNLPAGKACWAADELLAMASAVGQRDFEQREGLRRDFARAAEAALSRSVVRIDVDAHVVSF